MFSGLETRMCCKSSTFSLLINEQANEITGKAKHGISLGPTEIELFILLFADDFTCLHCNRASDSINALSVAAKKIRSANFEKSKVIEFRKGGFFGDSRERWFWNDQKLEVVNTYKYLGLFFLLDIASLQQWKTWESEQQQQQKKV